MKILVIDDDESLNKGIEAFLKSENFEVFSRYNGYEGIEAIQNFSPDLILTDIQMPEYDGLEVLQNAKKLMPDVPVVIMTAYATVENAVNAMKMGAEDYLTKPINLQELLIKVRKILKTHKILKENNELKDRLLHYEMPDLIGNSAVMEELKNMLKRISFKSDFPIIIYGESGTGKEMVAKNIHYMSDRKNKPFIPINCAALIDELLESELFGHKRGAFTGATADKEGLLMHAKGGTVFLDEISEMSQRVQSKLLRILQDGIIQPIGSNEMIKVDVRFICASNKKLTELVSDKKFRDDLYFRLNVLEMDVPPLRARKGDISLLSKHFFKKYDYNERYFTKEVLEILEKYLWPGNVRELENLIRMLLVTTSSPEISPEKLPQKFTRDFNNDDKSYIIYEETYKEALNLVINNFEKQYLKYHLKQNDYNISKTADSISISRVTLHKKIKEYDLEINS